MIEVFYEDWQYDCCGPYFSVGEYIWWPIEIGNYQKIINNKKRNIKYFCETHGGDVDRYISGKVKKIEAICGDEYIECKNTNEIKEMGYSFLVTLDDTEEFFYKDIKELNSTSNPFIKNSILKEKNVYTKINIIGDLNGTALSIAKSFNKNHYGINFYYKNKRKYKEYYNELKKIRSYSSNGYYDMSGYDISSYHNTFYGALNIIICDKNDYNYIYDYLLEEQKESVLSTLNVCCVKNIKKYYDIKFSYEKLLKNKFKYKKITTNGNKIIKKPEDLIDFLYNSTYKKIKYVNYKKLILFFFILWVIIKVITFIVRY